MNSATNTAPTTMTPAATRAPADSASVNPARAAAASACPARPSCFPAIAIAAPTESPAGPATCGGSFATKSAIGSLWTVFMTEPMTARLNTNNLGR